MNLLELKATVAAYHHVGVEELTKGPVDLFIVAANNARKELEQLHDFELCRCVAELDIDGVAGGALTDAVITPAGVFSGIKELTDVSGMRLNGEYVPLDLTRADISLERDRYELELSNDFWPENRYPSDAQFLNRSGAATLALLGNTLYNWPRRLETTDTPFSTTLNCIGWLKDYTQDQLLAETAVAQDFILDVGFSYLQWTIIIELNYLFQTYVPRQEGNVGSPTAMKQEALRKLILWDSFLIDPNSTRSR